MVGRTHGVHAEPITFGAKLAGWAFELERDRHRLERALEGMRVGKLSGAVGVYGGGDPEVERIACERLGLEPEPASTQVIPRDRHAELLSALALCASSLERFATEIRHLARTEVREVRSRSAGQKGSSAMPHKRNPIVAERSVRPRPRRSRRRARRPRERRPLARARHLALERRARRPARCVPGARLHARPVRVARRRTRRRPERMRAEPRRVARARLQPAGAARARRGRARPGRGLPPGAAKRAAAWDEERDFRELLEADEEIAARARPTRSATLSTSATRFATSTRSSSASPPSTTPKEETVHA